jgi:hypothetical protein
MEWHSRGRRFDPDQLHLKINRLQNLPLSAITQREEIVKFSSQRASKISTALPYELAYTSVESQDHNMLKFIDKKISIP